MLCLHIMHVAFFISYRAACASSYSFPRLKLLNEEEKAGVKQVTLELLNMTSQLKERCEKLYQLVKIELDSLLVCFGYTYKLTQKNMRSFNRAYIAAYNLIRKKLGDKFYAKNDTAINEIVSKLLNYRLVFQNSKDELCIGLQKFSTIYGNQGTAWLFQHKPIPIPREIILFHRMGDYISKRLGWLRNATSSNYGMRKKFVWVLEIIYGIICLQQNKLLI